MDAEERFHQKRMGYVKMLHSHETRHTSQFDFIELALKIRVG